MYEVPVHTKVIDTVHALQPIHACSVLVHPECTECTEYTQYADGYVLEESITPKYQVETKEQGVLYPCSRNGTMRRVSPGRLVHISAHKGRHSWYGVYGVWSTISSTTNDPLGRERQLLVLGDTLGARSRTYFGGVRGDNNVAWLAKAVQGGWAVEERGA